MTLAIAASHAFFECPKNRVWAQRFYLALIDHDYSFAQTLYAFENGARGARFDYWDS